MKRKNLRAPLGTLLIQAQYKLTLLNYNETDWKFISI